MLDVRAVSKTYGTGLKALDDVTFAAESGVFGLLGPNGAGKSTLMRTIATLQEPDSGAVTLAGQSIGTTAVSGPVTAGIRPEDFLPDPHGRLSMRVDIIEELGASRLLHGQIDGAAVTVHVGNDMNVSTGALPLSVKPDAISVFDTQTGLRV